MRAISIAEEASHPFSLAVALSWTAALHQLRGELVQTRHVAEAALALATEQIIPFFAAHATVLRGWALVEQGQPQEGITDLRTGVDAYHATGANLESPHWLALLAEACGKVGRTDEAQAVLREARSLVARTGIRYHEAELHRLEGEWLVGCDEQQSEVCFRRAMDIARAQHALNQLQYKPRRNRLRRAKFVDASPTRSEYLITAANPIGILTRFQPSHHQS
jgi:predicted ATPase